MLTITNNFVQYVIGLVCYLPQLSGKLLGCLVPNNNNNNTSANDEISTPYTSIPSFQEDPTQLTTRPVPVAGTSSSLPRPRIVFGVKLSDLVKRDQTPIPKFVTQCITTIDDKGLGIEGIFRIPGSEKHLKNIMESLESGLQIDFYSYDVHTIASLLKKFLRDLPEPLVTDSQYASYVSLPACATQEDRITKCRTLMENIPAEHRDVFLSVLALLHKTSHDCLDKTRMSSSNLSFIWGINVIRQDDLKLMSDLGKINSAMKILIDAYPYMTDLTTVKPPISSTISASSDSLADKSS